MTTSKYEGHLPFFVCRLRPVTDFVEGSIRGAFGGGVEFMVGLLNKSLELAAQAVRYDKTMFEEGDAKILCDKRGGDIIAEETIEPFERDAPALGFDLNTMQREMLMNRKQFALPDKTISIHWDIGPRHALASTARAHKKSVDEQLAAFADDDIKEKMRELRGVEIFAAGKHTDNKGRTRTFTISDLDQMVANAKALIKQKIVLPYLKFVHLDPVTHQRITSLFKFGDLENFRRVGTKLVVDVTRMPPKIFQLMKAGVFRRPSAEIWAKFTDATGRAFTNVVSCAGVLSAQHPAVNTLKDFLELFGKRAEDFFEIESVDNEEWAETFVQQEQPALCFYESTFTDEGGENDMDIEAVKKMIADAVAPIEKASADFQASAREALGASEDDDLVSSIKDKSKRLAAAEKTLADRDQADFERECSEIIHVAKRSGKLSPHDEHGVLSMVEGWKIVADANNGVLTFEHRGKQVEGSVIDRLKAHFDTGGRKVPIGRELGRQSLEGNRAPQFNVPADVQREMRRPRSPQADPASAGLDAQIQAYARENKVDYVEATEAIVETTRPAEPVLRDNESSAYDHREVEEA